MTADANSVDLAAVSRVARNVDLHDIRVISVAASCHPAPEGQLEPQITFDCKGVLVGPSQLNVACDYTLKVNAAGVQAAKVSVVYLLVYDFTGNAPTERDIAQFAKVNGVYHSWPFLRQFLFDLTAKMGMPPLTLPVFQVLSQARTDKTEKKLPAASKKKLPAKKSNPRRSKASASE
jgi:preprotein translocase subunit SecB